MYVHLVCHHADREPSTGVPAGHLAVNRRCAGGWGVIARRVRAPWLKVLCGSYHEKAFVPWIPWKPWLLRRATLGGVRICMLLVVYMCTCHEDDGGLLAKRHDLSRGPRDVSGPL